MTWPLRQFHIYSSALYLYVIAHDTHANVYRYFRVRRSETQDAELKLEDEDVEYSATKFREWWNQLEVANQAKGSHLKKVCEAAAIVGFVRFTRGYYLVVATTSSPVALIGEHEIHKVDSSDMLYLPEEKHPGGDTEGRYVRLFSALDLRANFYFSYSYDLRVTFQRNFAASLLTSSSAALTPDVTPDDNRFTWNNFLHQPSISQLHSDVWRMPLIYGFVGQAVLDVHGQQVPITLVARRSSRYAGTRYLKRGFNIRGDCANEVEVEQVVTTSPLADISSGNFSSFVQLRASVPAFWSSEVVNKMKPRPQVVEKMADSEYTSAGRHFMDILSRYGSPIHCLSLVKTRSNSKELTLHILFRDAIEGLNKLLPRTDAGTTLLLYPLDMAYHHRKPKDTVPRLADFARDEVLRYQGFFLNRTSEPGGAPPLGGLATGERRHWQTGVARVNCVDCLDRTNAAQFVIGATVLGAQLVSLGVLAKPELDFDSDCARLLEVLYERCGDIIAYQYGGSRLVHRVATYRHQAPWFQPSQGKLEGVSRYWQNTFSDHEKQMVINLFLGLYLPSQHGDAVWDFREETSLHSLTCEVETDAGLHTRWYDQSTVANLPLPRYVSPQLLGSPYRSSLTPPVFTEYFSFDTCPLFLQSTIISSRDIAPKDSSDLSPFIRLSLAEQLQEMLESRVKRSKDWLTVTRQEQRTSDPGSVFTLENISDSEEDEEERREVVRPRVEPSPAVNAADPAPDKPWFIEELEEMPLILPPTVEDLALYERYLEFVPVVSPPGVVDLSPLPRLDPLGVYTDDTEAEVVLRPPKAESLQQYDNFLKSGRDLFTLEPLVPGVVYDSYLQGPFSPLRQYGELSGRPLLP